MMSDELERYKLELNNREDNLNRMFNTKPNVGVIRPLDVLRRKVDGRSDPTPLSRLPPLYMSQYNANMAPQSVHSSTSTLAAAKPMAGVPPAVPANIPTSVLQQ
ncbi:MAG: hypothetical protein BJ554DRAFT_1638 [Olpidium bornovanus]|uniref:Uncharacterized protein n=1 Tax=Olpidium bornovanus TaxID=278681 RepID=A0A8H8DLN6_9FUNG|nr:MAG: hypothetical protein BJ554DRAFT_1638 [Olpidium bornovanus]